MTRIILKLLGKWHYYKKIRTHIYIYSDRDIEVLKSLNKEQMLRSPEKATDGVIEGKISYSVLIP